MNGADTAWMLMSTALVLLMTPALGFFYGGLVRSKNALNTIMMSVAALGFLGMAWAMLGYSLAFAPGNDWIGDLSRVGLRHVGLEVQGTIPHVLFMAYQGTFFIITAALISGAVVERMAFGPYITFITLWGLVIYAPIAHWVWGGGFLAKMGALDFAGGTVVHVNAGVAALVAAMVLGPRKDYGRRAFVPHNVAFTVLGAGLLWFGWFGFNAGSALAANASAALAFTNTMLAPAATLFVWTLLDLKRTGKATAVGAATGIVVGLVAVTPPRVREPLGAILLGGFAAFPSYYALIWRARIAGRLAGRGGRARPGRHGGCPADRRARQQDLERRHRRAPVRQPEAAPHPGRGRGRRHPVQRRRHVRAAQAGRALRAPAREQARRRHGPRRHPARRGSVRARRGRDPGAARGFAVGRRGRGPPGAGRRTRMKLVVAVVRPDKLSDVLEALFRAEVRGLTISRVQGHGGELERVENYRGTTVKMELSEKVRLEIGVSDHFVKPTVDAIIASARTGDVGDGKIFVVPVEKVYRIRTGEEDQAAVTPIEDAVPA
jgi:ammonium transporter